jgi:hypothetical protein
MAEDMRWSTLLSTLRATGTDTAVQVTAVSGALRSSTAVGGTVATDHLPSVATNKIIATLTVTGEAPDKNSIARYVEALEKVDVFANVFLNNAAEVDKKMQFTLSVDITADALGGRFSPTAAPKPAASTTAGGN